jgi:hypothetical protein
MVNRREFLGVIGVGTSAKLDPHQLAAALGAAESTSASSPQARESKAFGSGYFGEWITDQFGLPAYRYTSIKSRIPKPGLP